jgi:hypothetical protein
VVVSLGVTPRLGACPICARPVITRSFVARFEERVARVVARARRAISD